MNAAAHLDAAPPPLPAGDDPIAETNRLLLGVLRARGRARIEPAGHDYAVLSAGRDPTSGHMSAVPRRVGAAMALRMIALSRLDPTAPDPQVGRIRLRRRRGEVVELSLFVRPSPAGPAVEVTAPFVPDPDRDGALRAGPYRLGEELGRGGTGIVYRAEHELLERPAAVKVLFPAAAVDETVAARFVREARIAGGIRHPGIVEVYDFGVLADGGAYLAMELVDGTTLEAMLARDGALAPARAVELAAQAACALGSAHAAGVVHRDLKPANILLGADLRVKIADFGAAELILPAGGRRDTEGDIVIGTPHYMSPEHARGLATDARSDLYALGCILFEMLTGRPPFDGDTVRELLSKQVRAPLPPVIGPNGPVARELAAVVKRATAKDPADRHPTARALAADLDRVAALLERPSWRRWRR